MRLRHLLLTAVLAGALPGGTAPASAQPVPVAPAAEIGDLTGDGRSDILARAGDGRLVVYPQTEGNFGAPVTINHGWHGMRWIGSGRLDATPGSDVLAVDHDYNLWLYPNAGFDGTGTLGPRELLRGAWPADPGAWGASGAVDYWADGSDEMVHISYGDPSQSFSRSFVYLYTNTGPPGERLEFDHVEALAHAGAVWARFPEAPGSVTRGQYRDWLVAYHDGTLAVRVLEFHDDIGDYREITLGYGWNTLDSLMVKDIDRDGLPDILGRRLGDGALVVYEHSGQWSEASALSTYRPARVLSWGWHTVGQIS